MSGKHGRGRTILDVGDTRSERRTMKRLFFALAIAAVFASAGSAPAIDLGFGLFKKRAEKKEATKGEVVADKLLIVTLETDRDEARRKAAAAALKSSDPKPNFDAVAALSNAVLKDPSPDVRATAAEALGGFRVVYQQAVTALEKAEADDPDKGVRAAAKAALWQYSLSGYKPSAVVAKSQSAEPPFAKPAAKPTTPTVVVAAKPSVSEVPFRAITQGPGTAPPFAPSDEPPLAKPAAKPAPKPQPPAIPVSSEPKSLPVSVPSVPMRMPSTLDEPKADPPKTEVPKAELPAVSLPTVAAPSSPLPLPSVPAVPTLPPNKPVPTVQPPK
jgi:hypothetical protein